MKSPPVQIVDSEAHENTERFIAKNALKADEDGEGRSRGLAAAYAAGAADRPPPTSSRLARVGAELQAARDEPLRRTSSRRSSPPRTRATSLPVRRDGPALRFLTTAYDLDRAASRRRGSRRRARRARQPRAPRPRRLDRRRSASSPPSGGAGPAAADGGRRTRGPRARRRAGLARGDRREHPGGRAVRGTRLRHVRDVEVWSLAGADGRGRRVPTPEEAHAWIREHRAEREPWQRDDASLAHSRDLRGLARRRRGGARPGRRRTRERPPARGRRASRCASCSRAPARSAIRSRVLNLPVGHPAGDGPRRARRHASTSASTSWCWRSEAPQPRRGRPRAPRRRTRPAGATRRRTASCPSARSGRARSPFPPGSRTRRPPRRRS